MKEGHDFRNIVEEIINSYEIKVKTVTFLIRQIAQKVKIFNKEQIKMADRLKDILAKNRSLRRKDFDNMIADIRIQQLQQEKEITQMVEISVKKRKR